MIDRIEGKRAILEVDGETVEWPTSALPIGAMEGTILALVHCDEHESGLSKENEDRLKRLRDRDPGDIEIEI